MNSVTPPKGVHLVTLSSKKKLFTFSLCALLYNRLSSSIYISEELYNFILANNSPFEIRTLKKGHTEQRRTRRFYIVAIVRHRGTVGAWRNRGDLRVLLILWSTSLQSGGLQDFIKRLLPKLSAICTLRLCRSLCLWYLRDIVCFHLCVLPLSV